MFWYNIVETNEGCMIVKTVKFNHSIGTTKKFMGTMQECQNYCKENQIQLNVRKKIKK